MSSENFDIIVVGGGLGGLTAGAKLAKSGLRVLLLEQHNRVGGCATTFSRGKYTLEASLHELDGFDSFDFKTRIFHDLDLFNAVELQKISEFYRCVSDSFDITMPHGINSATTLLTSFFPEERMGIRKFFATIQSIRKSVYGLGNVPIGLLEHIAALPRLLRHGWVLKTASKSIGHFLDSIICDERLKVILSANMSYYHDDPYSMSLMYFALAQCSYLDGGSYYIKGGSQALSNSLASIIEKNSGTILLNSLVDKINICNNSISSVCYVDKKTHKQTTVEACHVIFNGSPPNLPKMISNQNALSLINRDLSNLDPSISLSIIYLIFNDQIKEISIPAEYSIFYLGSNVEKMSNFKKNPTKLNDYRGVPFVFVNYNNIPNQPLGTQSNVRNTASICFVDSYNFWISRDNETYKKDKEYVIEIFLEKLEKEIPGIRNCIIKAELGTPKTIERYTLNFRGSVYGFAQNLTQSGMRRFQNKSPIKNLYYASAWTFPGGGFTGAIVSGWNAARRVLKSYKK